MSTKIRIELEDATTPGVDSVDKNLGKIETAGGDAAAALDKTADAVEKIGDTPIGDVAADIADVQKSLDGVAESAGDAAAALEGANANAAELGQSSEDAEKTLNDVVASIEKLTAEIEHETKVVHEHTSSWSQMGAVAVPAVTGMVANVAKYSAEIGGLILKQQAIQMAIEKTATSQASLNLIKEQGAKTAAKAAASLTGYLGVVTSGLSLLAGAKAAQLAYNTILANTGKSADGLTNNLTRTREANSALWDDITTTAGAGADAVKDWGVEAVANAARSIDELTGVSTAWKEVDRAMTESTNNYVNNTRVIGEAIRGVSRDAVKASKEIAKAQADAVDDFDRVRMSNEEIEQAAKNRAEAERLASLDTVEAINNELHAMQQRRGEAAAANKFSEDDQKRYVAVVGSLEQKRTDITKREADERGKVIKQEADDRDKSDRDQAQRYEDLRNRENDKILDEYRDQAKAESDARDAREKAIDQFFQREMQKILDEEQKKFNAMQQAAQDRIDLVKRERQARIDAATGGTSDEGKALAEARGNISQGDLRKQVVDQAKARNRAEFRPQGDDARTFGAQRDRAEKQAGIDAFRQFNAGQTSQSDIASAQNSLINNQLQAAQGRGDLDQQTASVLMQAANNQASIIQTQQLQSQQLQQVMNAMRINGDASRNTFANGRRMANTR
jgi:hypothetical protein